jgi:hypothetical protein
MTEARLLADLASGYDLLVIGSDKWAQLVDPVWYGSEAQRDVAIAQLPPLVVVPRPPFPDPPPGARILLIEGFADVSSSGARSGRSAWMVPEALEFDRLTGAWTDPARYRRWVSAGRPVS